jgi:hypothetical protein
LNSDRAMRESLLLLWRDTSATREDFRHNISIRLKLALSHSDHQAFLAVDVICCVHRSCV